MKAPLVLLLFVAVSSIPGHALERHEKNPAKTAPSSDGESDTATNRVPTLAEQKMCADQARKFFNNWDSPKGPYDDYVDHYDPRADICYVAIMAVTSSDKDVLFSERVFNAFQRTNYGIYIQSPHSARGGVEIKPPAWCTVEPPGQNSITCSSGREFDALIKKYFNPTFQ